MQIQDGQVERLGRVESGSEQQQGLLCRGGYGRKRAPGAEMFVQDLAVGGCVVDDQDSLVQQRLLSGRFLARSRRGLPFEVRREPKGGALSHLALHADLSLHERDQFLDDREAETGSTETSGGGAVGLGEGLKNALMGFSRNADAGIFHLESKGDGLVRLSQRKDSHVDLAFCGEL